MFSLPWRKKAITIKDDASKASIDVSWLKQCLFIQEELPRPDWGRVQKHVDDNFSVEGLDLDHLWCEIAREWMCLLMQNFSDDYKVTESENFILISSAGDSYNKGMSKHLEYCRRRILFVSKGITSDVGFGKFVVIMFNDIESYYKYVSYFYGADEGAYGLSSGMYINNGYGHFVFVNDDMFIVEPIIAHEMTHALLSHLPIPLWLNEGLAVNMEASISNFSPERINKAGYQQHEDFWALDEIQEFWKGESFFRADVGQKLSYQLAQLMVSRFNESYDVFVEFVNVAHVDDAGEKAMNDIFGMSLGDLAAGFLGEGEWQPDPNSWLKNEERVG